MSGELFLDRFFRVNQEIDLPDGEKVTIRVLSDAEVQQVADYAVREQSITLSRMRDAKSVEYTERVTPIAEAPDEVLIDIIVNTKRIDYVREARDLYPIDFYPYPKGATPEEKIETQVRQAKHEKDVFEAQMKYVTSAEENLRVKLAGMTREAWLSMATNATINYIATQRRFEADTAMTLSMSIEADGKRKWTAEDTRSLPRKVQDALLLKYREVDSIDPWELTKSIKARNAVGVGTVDPVGERASESPSSE